MIKIILKVIWYIAVVFAFIFTIYFLFANEGSGINELKDLFSTGFWDGIKQFFVNIWNGIKFVCGVN